MDGRDPRDEWRLKIDLVEQLVFKEVECPDSVDRERVEAKWFIPSERDVARSILDELLSDDDSPLRAEDDGGICLTSLRAASNYVDDLYDDPGWFEP